LIPIDDVCVEIDGRANVFDTSKRLSSSCISSISLLLYLNVLIKYKRPVIISKIPKYGIKLKEIFKSFSYQHLGCPFE
jgi:hypothetical protein